MWSYVRQHYLTAVLGLPVAAVAASATYNCSYVSAFCSCSCFNRSVYARSQVKSSPTNFPAAVSQAADSLLTANCLPFSYTAVRPFPAAPWHRFINTTKKRPLRAIGTSLKTLSVLHATMQSARDTCCGKSDVCLSFSCLVSKHFDTLLHGCTSSNRVLLVL